MHTLNDTFIAVWLMFQGGGRIPNETHIAGWESGRCYIYVYTCIYILIFNHNLYIYISCKPFSCQATMQCSVRQHKFHLFLRYSVLVETTGPARPAISITLWRPHDILMIFPQKNGWFRSPVLGRTQCNICIFVAVATSPAMFVLRDVKVSRGEWTFLWSGCFMMLWGWAGVGWHGSGLVVFMLTCAPDAAN
jgi:hypothetical protein